MMLAENGFETHFPGEPLSNVGSSNATLQHEKQIRWIRSAYDDLLAFPKNARKEAGFQLGKVQAGLDARGIFRVM
jgi:hypothetical protein